MPVNYQEYDLKQLRKDKNLSQAELSDELKVSRSRLSRIENYKERLSYDQVTNLINAFEHIEEYRINKKKKSDTTISELQELKNQIEALKEVIQLKDELISSKNEQIGLLKSGIFGNDSRAQTLNLSYSKLNNKGKLINWNLLEIPSDTYKEIVPGIYDRLMTAADDIKFKEEEIFRKVAKKIDFDRYMVILNKSVKDSIFDLHYHYEKESILCVKGIITETITRSTLKAGDAINLESMQAHEIVCLSDCNLLILIEKTVKS